MVVPVGYLGRGGNRWAGHPSGRHGYHSALGRLPGSEAHEGAEAGGRCRALAGRGRARRLVKLDRRGSRRGLPLKRYLGNASRRYGCLYVRGTQGRQRRRWNWVHGGLSLRCVDAFRQALRKHRQRLRAGLVQSDIQSGRVGKRGRRHLGDDDDRTGDDVQNLANTSGSSKGEQVIADGLAVLRGEIADGDSIKPDGHSRHRIGDASVADARLHAGSAVRGGAALHTAALDVKLPRLHAERQGVRTLPPCQAFSFFEKKTLVRWRRACNTVARENVKSWATTRETGGASQATPLPGRL